MPVHNGLGQFLYGDYMNKYKYVVGTAPEYKSHNEGKSIRVPRFYKDTRNDPHEGRFSNIFTSSHNWMHATHYDTYEDAVNWMKEFLIKTATETQLYTIYRFLA